ncbi:MAG: Ig-like domain-containing protein [Aquabacterium sp.]|uniref:Ig-like domain-containing protein n=1 Tax=Aquabacterium sp. TaxID=1872578 RepID=UPI003BAE6C16
MPILSKSPSGVVTGLWGSAFVKLPNGKLKPLQMGDQVKPGEQIITTQDGIVQITNPKGKVAEVKPVAPVTDLDRDIAALESGEEATAAGLTGGGEGGLTPGLRVDRVSESVTQLSFQFGTERPAPEIPVGVTQPLFFTAVNNPPVVTDTPGNPGGPGSSFDPVTGNYTVTTPEDTPVSGQVKATDADGDTLSFVKGSDPTNGTVTVNPDGTWTYTPGKDYNGNDSFTVLIDDGHGGKATSTVNIGVTPVNDAPVAVDDSISTPEDRPVIIDVLKNDKDVDGDKLTVTKIDGKDIVPGGSVDLPGKGTVTLNTDGTLTFTPAPNYNGDASFTYTVKDPSGATDDARVTLTVDPLSDTPVAVADEAATPEDTPKVIDLLANDTDADGDKLTITHINGQPIAVGGSVELPGKGTVTLNADGKVTFTPAPNYHGDASFKYTVTDGETPVEVDVKVTVTPVNDAPVAVNDNVSTEEDKPIEVQVRNNDTDADMATDGDVLTVTAVTQGANGTVVINPQTGNPVYTPKLDFVGTDSFTYTIKDPSGATSTATVTVTVGGVNDAPVAQDDVGQIGQNAVLTVSAANGVILSGANPAGRDSDIDGDSLTVTAVSFNGTPGTVGTALQGQYGTLVLRADGSYTYTPNDTAKALDDGETGRDVFTYTVKDGGGLADTATLTVTVTGANDAPVAVADNATTPEDTTVVVRVLDNDKDIDGDTLTITKIGNQDVTAGSTVTLTGAGGAEIAKITVNADGTLTVDPAANYNGQVSFQYTISDGKGGTDTATVRMNVTPVNDPPEVTDTPANPGGPGSSFDPVTGNYSYTTPEDTPVSGQVKATDKDGDALTFTKGSDPTNGTVTVNPDGTWTYTPKPDYNGSDSFTVLIDDGHGGKATSTVNIGVTPVNDAPVLTAQTAAVSEEGLAGGLVDNAGSPSDTTNSATVSGSIQAIDPDGTAPTNWTLEAPTTALTSGGVAVSWTGNGTQTLTATAGGVTVGTLTIDNNGGYTFTLKAPLDHPIANAEDVLPLNFTVRASDGQLSGSTTLTINVEDDAPSNAVSQSRDTSVIDTNIMVILDMSTSMNTTDGVNGTTRLASAIASINALLDKYDALGDARVRLVTFGTNAEARGDVWTTVAEARTILAGLGTIAPTNQGTNYDEALGDAITAFSSAGKLASGQNVSYFISDGAPTYGSGTTSQLTPAGQSPGTPATNGSGNTQTGSDDTGIQAAEEALWKNFLVANQIDSFALGVGGVTAAQRTYLDPIAYDGRAVAERNGVIVSAFSQLDGVLASTVPASVSGNLLSGSFLAAGGSQGADAPGYVKSLTVNGVTYTYDPANGGSITVTGGTSAGVFDTTTDTLTITTKLADGSVGGKFIVDMDGGDYRYEVPPAVPAAGANEVLGFVISDRDGDTTGSTLTVNVSKPVITNGTSGADTLTGGSGIDFITGGDGNDTINGGAGDDKLYGNNGDDIINGGAGNDVLHGGSGNDTLNGGEGNDLLIGGAGNDVLTGGLGTDVFQWTLADPGTSAATRAVDTVKDFNVAAASAGGDVLDLRDLLTGENTTGGAGNLQNYLDFDTSGSNTVIRISPTGAFSNGNYTAANDHQQIVLEGVNIRTGLGLAANATDAQIITKLIQDGKLLVDN